MSSFSKKAIKGLKSEASAYIFQLASGNLANPPGRQFAVYKIIFMSVNMVSLWIVVSYCSLLSKKKCQIGFEESGHKSQIHVQ